MSKPKSLHISQATRYQNAALNYYLKITDSPYLHYGYWEPLPSSTDELTLGRMRTAQSAYAAKLLSFIPAGTTSVLDVGCGVGGNAAYLLERGFKVEGLAPDLFQQERFLKYTKGQAEFHLTRFEDFQTTHSYDLILLSESSQYMAALDIARCAADLLKHGGYLLLADMMRSDAEYNQGIFSNCHVVEELHAALVQSGFTLVKAEDISTQVAPTLDLGVESLRIWGLSTIRYIADVVAIAVPPLYLLLHWMFKGLVKKIVLEMLESPQIFADHLCYQIQLWHVTKTD